MSRTLDIAKQLIERASVTPYDAGCQPLLAKYLQPLGFSIEPMRFAEVDNLWARFGEAAPLLVFAGHTDVVPTGPEAAWTHPPFEPTIDGDRLYGRGAADMKSAIAAMVTAVERFVKNHPHPKGSIALLITSDEEGPSINGTVKVIEALQQRNERIDWCLVGEPSSSERLGDIIKNGRRGSLGGTLTVKGVQGHVAYPHQADNPIHRLAPALAELCAVEWDQGNAAFPPTTFQVSNIHGGTGANNVIPATVEMVFNFRFSTEVSAEQLQQWAETILQKYKLDYDLNWQLSGHPFVTDEGALIDATKAAISDICGYQTQLSTGGGTSDGRFIAPTGAQVVELGPVNASIHKIDEHVNVADLDILSSIYERILERLLT